MFWLYVACLDRHTIRVYIIINGSSDSIVTCLIAAVERFLHFVGVCCYPSLIFHVVVKPKPKCVCAGHTDETLDGGELL